MNILLVTTHLDVGGLAVYTVSLADGLTSRGHNVIVASRGGALVERLKALGIEHVAINIGTKSELSPRLLFAYSAIRQLIKQHHIHLLHAQTRVGQVVCSLAAKRSGIPFVATAHGFFRTNIGRRLYPCWGERTIAISKEVSDHLRYEHGVDPEKIRIVSNGVDLDRFSETPDDGLLNTFRLRLDIDSDSIIGTVARLSSVKGLDHLIRAMKYLEQKRPELRLLIVGDGPEKQPLLRLIKELDLESKVRLIDTVVETYLPLGVMSVFILSSNQEGLGISLLEAMASGVPVVATSVGGVLSVVKDGGNGKLVPPRDPRAISEAVLEILENKQLTKKFVQEARKTIAERFTLTQTVKHTEAVYRELVEEVRGE